MFKPLVIFVPTAIWIGRFVLRLQHDDAINRVKYVDCPILFMTGEMDAVAPPGDAAEMVKASANKYDEVLIVPRVGHSLVYKSNPEEFINRVLSFLKNCLQLSEKHGNEMV